MKNVNNWKLIALLGIFVLAFVAVKYFRSPKLESTLPEQLTSLDTAKVTEIVVTPAKDPSGAVRLIRTGGRWELKQADRSGHLEQGGSIAALRALARLEPQRLMSRKRDKWNDFSVGDSTGTRVQVMAGNSVEADLMIGKVGFTQGPGGNFSGGAYTYIRVRGEDEVYSVEGFLDAQFNRVFNDWRDQRFIRLKRDSIDKITFRYPADSSFVLEKKNGKWSLGNEPADSAAVNSYLAGLEYRNVATFSNQIPSGDAAVVASYEQRSKLIARAEGWPLDGRWVLKTSEQPDTYFTSDGSTVMQDVWKGRKAFQKAKAKK